MAGTELNKLFGTGAALEVGAGNAGESRADPAPAAAATPAATTTETPAAAATTTTTTTAAPATTTAAPAAASPPPGYVPIAVMLDERERRQTAEAKLKPAETPKRPDAFADPEGARQYDEQATLAREIDTRCNLSDDICRSTIADYAELMKEWPAIQRAEPYIYQVAVTQPNPARYIYEAVKSRMLSRKISDGSYEKELRAKWDAEKNGTAGAATTTAAPAAAPAPGMPQTMAAAPAASSRTEGAKWQGSTSLDDALKRPKKAA